MTYELELRSIVKFFGPVLANDHVSLGVESGEIRALVGENGAGKSTLMSIAYGEQHPDEGEIYVRGERRQFGSPIDAIRAGLGMVHQSFMLFPSLTVVENIVYGSEPSRSGFINWNTAAARVREVAEQHAMQVNPQARVGDLPVGVQQRVEILKALYRNATVLILDEPTGVLTPQEVEGLFVTLRALRDQGKTIIFITHKLHEVMRLCDRATILRDGRIAASLDVADTTPEEIARSMTGRDVLLELTKPPARARDVVLEVRQLSVKNETGRRVTHDVSLHVRGGEIVGIAGVAGNGQTELIEALMGLRPVAGGHVTVCRQDVTQASVGHHRRAGLAYVPEDRAAVGAAPRASVAYNLIMGFQNRVPISRHGLLHPRAIQRWVQRLIDHYSIKVARVSDAASSLSGGNLQKVTLARELSHDAPCLIVEQPTRGLDIGAIEFVHEELLRYRSQGHAVLLVSAELSEIRALSDRILVMFEGRIAGEVLGGVATEAQLGLMMAGAAPHTGEEIPT
jgi:ABC-type uncharacterized transport system ATPase subunit